MQRVAITGIGLLAPTGRGIDPFWDALLRGASAIRPITRFDPSSYPCGIGGQVPDGSYEDLVAPRLTRTTTLATRLAMASAELALRDARLSPDLYPPERRGISVGTALGGWREGEQQYGILVERGARRVNPFVANGAANHAPGVELAAQVGAQGSHTTFTSGCPSSLQALSFAAARIAAGDLDLCIAGGFETPLTHLVFAGLTRTQELSTLNDSPERASRPFDRDHAGMVLSEGSCLFVLESEEAALRRNAPIRAFVLGSATSCDAMGVYATDPTGEPAAVALRAAVLRSGLEATDIHYVCSHANSLATFDKKEATVLKRAFGEYVGRLPVSSIKGVTGHPFGASGALQTAAAVLALQYGLVPPTANLESRAPECDLRLPAGEPLQADLQNALVTSYGYGGVNSFLVLGRA